MAHLRFESGIDECLKNLEAPITNGPQFRWQRKQEQQNKRFQSNGPFSPIPNNYSSATPAKVSRKTPLKTTRTQKTPKKTPKKPHEHSPVQQGDRFIPNRSATDCEWSHFQLVHGNNDQENIPDAEEESNGVENQQNRADQSKEPSSKILHFKTGAPVNKEGYQNNLRVLYCQSRPAGPKAKSTRHIPQAPDRILDAPEMLDDYYLNLLDWSNDNLIGLALGGAVYIWNADSGETRHLLQMEGEDYVSSVSWIKTGSILAVGTCNGQVQSFVHVDGTTSRDKYTHAPLIPEEIILDSSLTCLDKFTFYSDEGLTSETSLWDVETSKCVRAMSGHASRVGALSWNSYILSSGSRSGAIHNHDVRVADHHVGTLLNHTQEICGLSWSLDGKLLASGGNDNVVNIWPMATGDIATNTVPLFSLNHHQAAVKALSWCPWQSNVLASGGGTADRHIRFWNAATGACLNSVDTKSQVCAILWSSEYKEIISGHGFSQNQLTIWKYPLMSRVTELTGHTSRVLHMAMSPDRQHVASVAADETLRIWKCFARVQKQKKASRGGEESSNLMSSMKLR